MKFIQVLKHHKKKRQLLLQVNCTIVHIVITPEKHLIIERRHLHIEGEQVKRNVSTKVYIRGVVEPKDIFADNSSRETRTKMEQTPL